jgi:hypothetical protein
MSKAASFYFTRFGASYIDREKQLPRFVLAHTQLQFANPVFASAPDIFQTQALPSAPVRCAGSLILSFISACANCAAPHIKLLPTYGRL